MKNIEVTLEIVKDGVGDYPYSVFLSSYSYDMISKGSDKQHPYSIARKFKTRESAKKYIAKTMVSTTDFTSLTAKCMAD
jgi:hypothetical protein